MTGIALKRTHFPNINAFLEAIVFADQYHNFVFLDYEGLKHLLDPNQLETIIEQIRHFLVFTIAVRGGEFHFQRKHLLENYLRLARKYSNLLFCIVAGHPAYPSVDTNLSSINGFHNILTRIRNKNSSVLFLGIENLSTSSVQKISHQYRPIIPFILHGDSRAVRSNIFPPPLAVYSPLAHSIPDEEAIKSLLGYLLRRKATQQALKNKGYYLSTPPINKEFWPELLPEIQTILRSSFHNFVLTSQNFHSRMRVFLKNGVQLVVGNPAIPEHFFDLIRSFKFNRAEISAELNIKPNKPSQKRLNRSSEIIQTSK